MRPTGRVVTLCFALIVVATAAITAQPGVLFRPAPGEYAENIELTIAAPTAVRYRFENSDRFVEYTRPLELTAIAGESRRYVIVVRTQGHEQTVSYHISRAPPATPVFDPPPGRYGEPVRVRFIVPERQSVFYTIDADTTRFLAWDGSPVEIGEHGPTVSTTTEHTIRAYSTDAAGRFTEITSASYVIDPGAEPDFELGLRLGADRVRFDSSIRPPRVSLDVRSPAGPAYVSVEPPEGATAVFVVTETGEEIEPSADSPEIRGEHAVRVPWGMRRDFAMTFRSRSDNGTLSADTERILFTLDRVPPARPEITVEEPDFAVSIGTATDAATGMATGEVFYRVEADYPNVPGTTDGFIRYENPFQLSPFLDDVPIRFVVSAYSRGENGLIGSVTTKHLTPEPAVSHREADVRRSELSPPKPIGIEDGRTYPGAVTIRVPMTEETVVRYAITENDQPDPFGPNGSLYREPITLSGRDDAVTEYRLRFAGVGTTGEIALSAVYTIAIDRRVPGPVAVIAFDTKTEKPVVVAANPVRIEMIADLGEIYYEIERDRVARPPDRNSTRYDGPITLGVSTDARQTEYVISAAAVTESGVWGRITEPARIVIDRRVPGEPPSPAVQHDSSGEKGLISWRTFPDFELKYRFLGAESPNGEFTTYAGPVSWAIPAGREDVTVEYALTSSSGTFGPSNTTTIQRLPTAPAPTLTGIEHGAVVNARVLVVGESDTGVVRYELARDGRPSRVTEYSPELPDQLELDVDSGVRARFQLAARTFVDGKRPSETVTLEFAINKAPPPAPELRGVVHGGHYQEARELSLAPSAETVFISIVTHADEPTDDDFAPYDGPLTLHPVDGAVVRYRIDAYARDAAGNTSPRATTIVYFDTNVVYVAPDGDDNADGTRESPLETIAAGIAAARTHGRRTIFIASGTYRMSAPIEITDRVSIFGGRSREDWGRDDREADGRSFIVADHGRSTIRVLTDGVELTDLVISSKDGPALEIAHGAGVAITRGHLAAHAVVVAIDGGIFRSDGVRIESSGSASGAAVEVSNGSVSFAGGAITARGKHARAVLATNSESSFSGSSIVADAAGEYVTAVSVFGGHFEGESLVILASAELGSTAIRSDGATFFLETSRVHATSSGDFAYIVSQNGGTTYLENSVLTAAGGTDRVGALVRGGGTFEAANVVIGTPVDEALSYGLWLRSGGAVHFRDSILLGDGIAIAHEGATLNIVVSGTYFGGWDSVYTVERRSFGRVDRARGVGALEARDDVDASLNLDGPRDVLDADFNPTVDYLVTPPIGVRADSTPSLPDPRN